MAKQKVKITTKTRVKKSGAGKTSYKPCNMCHGTGVVKR
jgi:DnaJ-class molecular chaperone